MADQNFEKYRDRIVSLALPISCAAKDNGAPSSFATRTAAEAARSFR
jgi:hypothetical protein